MNLNKSSKALIAITLTGALVLSNGNTLVLAVNQSDLNKKNEQIETTKGEISEVKVEMSAAMREVNELVMQISEYETEITNLTTQIDDINNDIEENEIKLEKTQKELEEKQRLFEQRIVALYESGSTTYIDVLLSSQGITDFISNYYLIGELASYDTELINSIRNIKEEIERTKNDLEESKKELEDAKEQQVAKQNALLVAKSEKDAKVANLSDEEKKLEAELSQFEKDKQDIYNELARQAAEEEARKRAANNTASFGTSSNNTSPSVSPSGSSGYIFPVAGLSRASINNPNFPSYKGHTGVDINIGVVGKTIVAVKDGTVEKSLALRNPDGSYRSYGEYVVINHHDGTKTLYAHMLSGSRRVEPGQTVTQGQALGIVGETGHAYGVHLHFEVLVGGYPVNPMPYLP